MFFHWVPTENAEEVITGITAVKKLMTNDEFKDNEPENYQLSKDCLNYNGNEYTWPDSSHPTQPARVTFLLL